MITDKQWKKLEPLFPKLKRRRDRRGRPWADNRACFEGVLWVLRTGARWRDLPPQYPSGSTCWRRLQDWEEQGALEEIWHSLLSQLDRRGLLRWEETFHGRQFCSAKKGAWPWEKPSGARAVPSPAPLRPQERTRSRATHGNCSGGRMGARDSGWHVEREGVWKERCNWSGRVK
jgi:transposase